MSRDRTNLIILAAILCLAALLRLWNLDASEFKYDEARVSNLAAHFVDRGIPPVRGMGSSAGIDNPPLAIYLLALPVLLSRDPLVVTAFVALFNVVGVGACYWLGKRHWSTGVGLAAATLLATSPWAVFYSRKVWAQDLLLPFVVLLFGFLLAWAADNRRWALTGAVVTLTALTQIHLATVAFIPLLAIVLLCAVVQRIRGLRTWEWVRPLLVGIAISAALYAPYIAFDALTGWRNLRALSDALVAPAQIRPEAVQYALLNVGGREIHALAGPERFQQFLEGIIDLRYWPDRIGEALAVASVAYLALRLWRNRTQRRVLARDALLLLWLFTPVLFYLRSSSPVYPHYLIPLYPAPYLAIGIGVNDLLEAIKAYPKARKTAYALCGVLGVALIAWQIYLSFSIHAFVETHHTPGGIGTPIGILRRVAQSVHRLARERAGDAVVALCPGDDPAVDECPAVLQFMVDRERAIRFADYDASLLLPAGDTGTLILLAPGTSIAADELDRYADPLPDETIWLREGAGAYRFYYLLAGQTPTASVQPPSVPARLMNGVSLLGYRLSSSPTAGQKTRLTLFWRVDTVPADRPLQGYSFANHLIAGDGKRYGQMDGPGYAVQSWQNGDIVLSWFDIPVAGDAPGAPYLLRVGMYTYIPPDQFIPVYVLDEQGHPGEAFVEWSVP